MARGKSSTGSGGKRGRPSANSKKEVKKEEEDNNDVVEQEDASDNEQSKEDEDSGDLPAIPSSVPSTKKIFIAPKSISEDGWENVEEVYVKHPRTNVKSLFLLCKRKVEKESPVEDFRVFEVLTMQQETRSWFMNNRVISDGNLYVCTQVDPLFLILPTLAKSSKAMPIVDHLSEDSTLSSALTNALAKCLSHKQLENVSIKKGCDDIVAFVYSEDKVLTWLKEKAEKVADYLLKKGISHVESSVSSNFVKSSTEVLNKDDCLRYACDIVGEYIEESLKRKLLEKCGLPILSEKTGVKRKGENENEGSNKKTKLGDGENVPLEDYGSANNTPVNKATKVTAREKEFQKAAQGSHSLLKFFGAKPKK